ncbi:uncharacterized protein LOC123655822 [Melitaea cinxia]|uniref:uncharacterized protein LOC123655822 n=1 Tax=Melitaea cinxia TaxID=113334 RepID=UPI001E273581|nr:uncharacterized protein LOC123655822 [Melitaea cinxia]
MRKLFILFLYLTIAQCASVNKRDTDEEYAKSKGEETKKVGDNKEIKDNQPEIGKVEGNEPTNKENPKINYQEPFQNFYYLVPLGTEILYPVDTMDMPIVYYFK